MQGMTPAGPSSPVCVWLFSSELVQQAVNCLLDFFSGCLAKYIPFHLTFLSVFKNGCTQTFHSVIFFPLFFLCLSLGKNTQPNLSRIESCGCKMAIKCWSFLFSLMNFSAAFNINHNFGSALSAL